MERTPAGMGLPTQLTRFFGREAELGELATLLREHRLVTVAGIGGAGKTRLAFEAVRTKFPPSVERVAFVDLAPTRDPALVPAAVLQALGLSGRPGDATSALAEQLADARLLLLLDNCEHLPQACAALAAHLLALCPGVRVLATSRAPLGVEGEVVWRLPPFEVPANAELLPVDRLRALPAVALFLDRARSALPSFELTSANAPDVVRVCRLVDAIPLAIELAASRVRALPVSELAARLSRRLPLLTGGATGTPERQRTMRGTIAWSFGLLDAAERTLFRRLAVFSGGWTLEAAEGICSDDQLPADVVLDVLQALVDRSLVVAELLQDHPRYHFLETVREFARDELIIAGEAETFGRQHCRWFRAFGERGGAELEGPGMSFWNARLDADLDNLRAALDWAEHDPLSLQDGLLLAGSLAWFWGTRGYLVEGYERCSRLLSLSSTAVRPRLLTLLSASSLAIPLGDLDAMDAFGQAALELANELGEADLLARVLLNIGHGKELRGAFDEALATFDTAVNLAREVGFPSLEAMARWHRSCVLMEMGGMAESLEETRRAQELARRVGHMRSYCMSAITLGELARLNGDFAEAEAQYREAQRVALDVGNRRQNVLLELNLGFLAIQAGTMTAADAHLAEAARRGLAIGNTEMCRWSLMGLAVCLARRGQPEVGARVLGLLDSLIASDGVGPQAADLAIYDLAHEATRAALGTDFERHHAAGASLSLREAIGEALAALPATEAPAPAEAPAGLTRREIEILRLVAEGETNRAIADQLVLSVRTVETHVANIYAKIGARGRADAVAFAARHGLLATAPATT